MENVTVETKEGLKTTVSIRKVFRLQVSRLEITLAVIYNAYSLIDISALCPLLATKIRSS